MVEGLQDLAVVGLGARKQRLRLAHLLCDTVLLGAEQIERDGIREVGSQQLAAFVFELREPAALASGLAFTLARLPVEIGEEVVPDGRKLLGRHLRRAVQLRDLVFDDLGGEVLEVAAVAFVAAEAEEVEVGALGERQAQPRAAPPAVDGALEVVGVNPLLLPRLVMGGENLLHTVELLAGDKGLVTPGIDHTTEADVAHVVRVPEDAAELCEAHGLRSSIRAYRP